MMDQSERAYLRALGARVLSEANDLKRTPEALAVELGMSVEDVRAVIDGESDVSRARSLISLMAEVYPVSLANLWIDKDDTEDGVRIMSSGASKETSRIFDRRNRNGGESEYYEYRDTAMSRLAPFKPEWIAELRRVDDADPYNADVAYNNGHLMHQTTFVVGPVNFYWESGGKRYCEELNTGDSNYITPFVPHSFTSRDPDQNGLIIAVTYAGEVGLSLREFMNIGADALNASVGDLRDELPYANRLRRHMAAESISVAELARRLCDTGMDRQRAELVAAGQAAPNADEIVSVAEGLSIRPADLMASPMREGEEVVIRRWGDKAPRAFPEGNQPAYMLTELARTRHQPYLKGFEVTVLGGTNGNLSHGLHEYIYNYGDQPVEICWGEDRRQLLEAGASAYVRPYTNHCFDCPEGAEEGHLVMIRVPGRLGDVAMDEFASFAPDGRDRVAGETRRWF